MSHELSEVKQLEESKRDAVLGESERWRLLMETITWVEKQPHVQRNTPARCLQLQRAKLADRSDCEENNG